MKISLLDGRFSVDDKFTKSLQEVITKLSTTHQLDHFPLATMDLQHCTGCWDCWTKTPGKCRIQDDGADYLMKTATSELVLVVSPVKAGFISSITKKALDRFIPNLLPFIDMYHEECHHRQRYPQHRKLALFLLDDGTIDKRAEEIINENFSRIQLNFKSETLLTGRLSMTNAQEVADEISNM